MMKDKSSKMSPYTYEKTGRNTCLLNGAFILVNRHLIIKLRDSD